MRGTLLFALVALVGFVALTSAQAADPDSARVEPRLSTPGEMLHLTYTVPSPGPVDVGVQRSATCALTAPDGSSASCVADSSLVVVKLAPGATTYSWDIPAPAQIGNYTATFQEKNLVALPGAPPAAQAHFEVAPKPGADPLAQNALNNTAGATPVNGSPAKAPAEPSAVAKFILTAASSAGSLVLLLLAHRFGS